MSYREETGVGSEQRLGVAALFPTKTKAAGPHWKTEQSRITRIATPFWAGSIRLRWCAIKGAGVFPIVIWVFENAMFVFW